VAALSAAPTSGAAPLDVVFADLSTGAITAWSWDFGDGASSTLANPAHTFITPGNYTVALTVSGPGGSDVAFAIDMVSVSPAAPGANFTASVVDGIAPLAVDFADLSTGAITAWSWDFGDGVSSTLASPTHVYAAPGLYSVALTVTGPGGTNTLLRTDLISVRHAVPVADFSATPREGFAPLVVALGDLSTGTITGWSWDFGDGSGSTVASPTHLFTTPGSYPVVLRVEGPGGSSTRQRTIVVRAAPAFADGSFEAQPEGLEPGTPWRVFRGNGIFVRAAGLEPGFPADGALLCDLGAEGSANATPPSNPGGAGVPAIGLSGLEQSFQFPVDAPHLFFEAAFVRNGSPSSAQNDFMSVDIGDGTTIWNLFHADTFSDFPRVSALHGLPMTEPRGVHVDLRALFPSANESTVLTLRFGVGNHGNGSRPARGWIDGFRFRPSATAVFRNGRGLNPVLYVASPAVIGGFFTVDIDGSLRPEARLALVVGRENPLAGSPLLGGELLVVGRKFFTLSVPLSGAPTTLRLPMPSDTALVGLRCSTQAILFGGGLTLSNAYDLRLGY
jgi:PKD repeat protein